MYDEFKKPSLCLIGTSNAVFADGYSRVFADSKYLKRFEKHALGFSSSLMFSMMAPLVDFSEHDICIIDFAANDGSQLAAKVVSYELIRTAIEDAVVRILDKGCIPALFILPVLSLYTSKNFAIRDLYIDVGHKFNLPVYDGYKYLEFVHSNGHPVAPLFKDDMHLTRDNAAILAAAFLEGILIAHRIKAPDRVVRDSGFTYHYLSIDKLEVDPSLIGHRKTKLFAAGVADIRGSTLCRVSIPDVEIVGMGVDWANTSGTLHAVSQNTTTLSVNNPYSGADPARFVFGIYPWLTPVAIQNGIISINATANEKVDGEARIALGGLIARKPADYEVTCLLSRSMNISDSLFSSQNVATFRDAKRWNRPIHFFENLEDFIVDKSTPSGVYTIKVLRTFFDILVQDRKSTATIVVFHAATPNRAEIKLPFFAGQKLAGADANVILVSDPGLYTSQKVPLAWFAGRKGCPIQPILLLILKKIIEQLGTEQLIFTGPSGGGFASLYYSYFFPDSLSVPSNPQTVIGNFNAAAVDAYCSGCFGASDNESAERILRTEIDSSLPDLYAKGVPNYIIYCQNNSDDHVELHEKPFRDALPSSDAQRAVFVHGSWGIGHVAPPAMQWSQLLSAAVNWRGGWAQFLQMYDFSELGTASRVIPETRDDKLAEVSTRGESIVAEQGEIQAVLFYGQSNCGAPSFPVTRLREARHADSLLTLAGAQTYGSVERSAGNATGFVPFANPNTYLMMQTPAGFFAEHLRRAGSGAHVRLNPRVFHTTWLGGRPISAFLKDTPPFGSIVSVAEDITRIAHQEGRDTIAALVWIHGEGISREYLRDLRVLVSDLNEQIVKATGQSEPVKWLIAQTNNRSGNSEFNQVPLDQLHLSHENASVTLIGPMYQLPFISLEDLIHPNEEGRVMYGELIGYVYHRVVVEGLPFRPLQPLRVTGAGNYIDIVFSVPDLPLAFDVSWVKPVPHYGFVVASGADMLAIADVAITGADTVRVTLCDPLPLDELISLSYAMGQGESANGWAGARGQLMSPTRIASLHRRDGFVVPENLAHYCVRFQAPVEVL